MGKTSSGDIMKTFRFSLGLSESELLKFYAGHARNVIAKDSTGKTVQFPIEALRPFIGRDGVYGKFVLHVDDNFKLVKLVREGDL